MFSVNDIRERILHRPFVPLRLKTSGGEAYDIYHPDLVMVGRRDLIIGTASTEDPRTYEQVSRVSIMHVTALEDLPASRPIASNGEQ